MASSNEPVGPAEPLGDELLSANAAFYAAFAAGNVEVMEALWSADREVTCTHPGWCRLDGRDAVLSSWRQILGADHPPEIGYQDPRAMMYGACGVVHCTEQLGDVELAAVNVFARETGGWKLVHHQSSQIVQRPPAGRVLN